MNLLGYCRRHTETAVQEAILSTGRDIQAFVPMEIEAKRQGKQRYAEPVESPVLPNAIFIRCSADDWHRLRAPDIIRAGLSPTMMFFPDKSWRYVAEFIDRCAEEYARVKRMIERGQRITQYTKGERVAISDQLFADRVATFLEFVEHAHQPFPSIRVEVEMMGRAVKMEVDPLDVRKIG